MATYSVTCSNVGSFTHGNRFTLYVKLSNRDGNPATNKSVVDYEAYFENTSGGGTFSSKTRLYFAINGKVIKDSTGEVTGPRNGKVTIAQGSITVDHNPDGNKSVGFQALVQSTNLGIYGNIENSFALTKIPRYTSITRFAVNKRDETSVTFDYATSDTTDYAWYSKDNGSTWSNLPTNNIVTGLSANTTYNFKLRVRRKDSQLTTDSGTYAQTTYNYPYCTEAPDFVIGNNVTVKFYNPLNRSIQIRMWSHRSAQFVSDLITTSGTSYTGFSNIASNLYASIPDHTNSRYKIDVHYGSNKAIKEGGNYRTVGNEAPSFYNFTYRDTDAGTTALTGNNQTIVKGYSNVEAIVSTANKATPKKSASMSKYRLSIGEATAEVAYSSSAQVATTIPNVSSNSFTMYAIDSRGYSTAKTITASTYINYSPIKITSLNAIRTNSVTSETTLNFSGTIWNGSFGSVTNAISSCSYRYRRAGTSTWTNGKTNVTPTKNGSNFSFSGKIVGDLGATGFNIDNGYEIQVLIADKLSNNHGNPNTFTLGPGTPAMAIYKNNVAVGQRYDTSVGEKMQINGNVKLQRTSTNAASAYFAKRSDTGTEVYMGVDSGGINHGLYSINHNKWLIFGDGTNVRIGTTPSGNAGTPAGGSTLVIKSVNNKEAPNNGVVLEYGNSTSWVGQLYIGDNATQGIYYNGWSDGVRGSWIRLADAPVVLYNNASGTTGTVQLSESTANFNYLEIFYARKSSVVQFESVKVYSPNSKSIGLSLNYSNGGDTSQYYSKIVTISGTNIAVTREIATTANGTYGTVSVAESTVINIYKVIGYR